MQTILIFIIFLETLFLEGHAQTELQEKRNYSWCCNAAETCRELLAVRRNLRQKTSKTRAAAEVAASHLLIPCRLQSLQVRLHPDQIWRWPFCGCESPADTPPSYLQCCTPAASANIKNTFEFLTKRKTLYISFTCVFITHVEHAELRSGNFFLSRPRSHGPAVMFADFSVHFASVCPFIAVTHLLAWCGIGVDTDFGNKKQE